MKISNRAAYRLAQKFTKVPDPSIVVTPSTPLTAKEKQKTFHKKYQVAWYPSFPLSEARKKKFSYGLKDGT